MTNVERARRLVAQVHSIGATDFCCCAGSRNSPILAALGRWDAGTLGDHSAPATERPSDLRLYSFVDERSASFFALGRAKQQRRPTAVVTTSGTAVAELLPAVIEAYYSSSPLILITADRPARYRGTGAPQAIEQIGIFGEYAATSIDGWSRAKPLHLNIEFDEPLIDE